MFQKNLVFLVLCKVVQKWVFETPKILRGSFCAVDVILGLARNELLDFLVQVK